jgi:hypothetical protein
MRNWSLALLAIICCALPQRVAAQMPVAGGSRTSSTSKPNGVLLGTHWSSGDTNFGEVKAGDRTWWVAEVDGTVRVVEIRNILFPRKNGFWLAGTNESQDGESFQRYVWTAPLGEQPRSVQPDLSNSSCHDQTNARDLLFVGSSYLAIREFESAACGNYGEGTTYYVTTPENPSPMDTAEDFGVKVSDVLGPGGLEQFNNALKRMGEAKSDDLDCGKIAARSEDWAILRDKGHWVARGNGSYGGHVCDGYFGTEFDIPVQLLKNVVGYDELAIGWKNIQKNFSDAKDAFESPNENFLLVIRNGELVVCMLAGAKISVISRHTLHQNEYGVMSQWALGDNVVRWDQQVSRVKNLELK